MTRNTRLLTVGDDGSHRGQPTQTGSVFDWQLRVTGAVHQPLSLSLDELWSYPIETRPLHVLCVSSGKITRPKNQPIDFSGVSLRHIAERAGLQRDETGAPLAKSVRFISRAPGGCGPRDDAHHTALPLSPILSGECPILLTGIMDDQAIPYANGGPLRSVAWGFYFYKSIKWLHHIEFVTTPIAKTKGTWEQHAGYHHQGRLEDDKFEPYLHIGEPNGGKLWSLPSPDTKGTLEAMKEAFSDQLATGDMSQVQVARTEQFARDLATHPHWNSSLRWQSYREDGTLASAGALRGCRLNRMDLTGWNLAHVNLSLASCVQTSFADEHGEHPADLRWTDCEGAIFWGANLHNVDMRGAYLGGATFCKENGGSPADVRGLKLEGARGLDPDTAAWLTARGAQHAVASTTTLPADTGDLLPCHAFSITLSASQSNILREWAQTHQLTLFSLAPPTHANGPASYAFPVHQRDTLRLQLPALQASLSAHYYTIDTKIIWLHPAQTAP